MPLSYQSDSSPMYVGRLKSYIAQASKDMQAREIIPFSESGLDVTDTVNGLQAYPFQDDTGDTVIDWSGEFAMSDNGKFVICGSSAGNSQTSTDIEKNRVTIFGYDDLLDNWFAVRNPWDNTTGHQYDSTCVAGNTMYKAVYSLDDEPTNYANRIFKYDLDTMQADGYIDMPNKDSLGYTNGWSVVKCIEYFPTWGGQGSIVWINDSQGRIMRYDLALASWVEVVAGMVFDSQNIIANYHAAKDVIVFSASSGTSPVYTIDNTGNVTNLGAPTGKQISCGGSVSPFFVSNPSGSNEMILFPKDAGATVSTLNLDTGLWTDGIERPSGLGDLTNAVAVGIPEHNAVLMVVRTTQDNASAFLYRHDARV